MVYIIVQTGDEHSYLNENVPTPMIIGGVGNPIDLNFISCGIMTRFDFLCQGQSKSPLLEMQRPVPRDLDIGFF